MQAECNPRDRIADEFPGDFTIKYGIFFCAARRHFPLMGVSSQSPQWFWVPTRKNRWRMTRFSFARVKGKLKQNRLEITMSVEDLEVFSSFSSSRKVSGTGLLFAKNQPLLAQAGGVGPSPALQSIRTHRISTYAAPTPDPSADLMGWKDTEFCFSSLSVN